MSDTSEKDSLIEAEIDYAYEMIRLKKPELAVLSFAKARKMACDLCDGPSLRQAIQRETRSFEVEREMYRDLVPKPEDPKHKLTIFADSLGLPRPDEKEGVNSGAEICYAWKLAGLFPETKVDALCQRFLTTEGVLDALLTEPDLAADSDVVLHVGLNDCASRMFLTGERLSLRFLPEELRNKIVRFSQPNRAAILKHLPTLHYVSPEQFRGNMQTIIGLLRARKARKIVMATIILPPVASWRATYGVNRNFASYNLDIMNAAHENGALLMDIDRHMWQAFPRKPLNADNIHLSELGHSLFADTCAALLR